MWAVRFEGVTKRYRINQTKYRSVRADATDLIRRAIGRPPTGSRETVAALRDLDLEIPEGTSTAIIGRNGAGKSTALRLASRITYPTEGRVRVRGRVGALIEIGAGVHPELSGRENIGLYGSFLGFSRANIKRRFDEIVDFAEIESSVDTAVKYYSTGMKLRLGFAIAAFLEPAIFIVDESLAVGDGAFQAKCINRMHQLGRDGATIVFVSHELPAVEALCERAVWLDRGRLVKQGSIGEVLREYSRSLDDGTVLDEEATIRTGSSSGSIRCLRVVTSDDSGRLTSTFRSGDPVTVRLTFAGGVPDEPHRVSLRVRDGFGGDLVELATDIEPNALIADGRWSLECRLESLPLNPRMYQLWCAVGSGRPLRRRLDWTEVGGLRMEVPGSWSESRALASTAGPALAVPAEWRRPV